MERANHARRVFFKITTKKTVICPPRWCCCWSKMTLFQFDGYVVVVVAAVLYQYILVCIGAFWWVSIHIGVYRYIHIGLYRYRYVSIYSLMCIDTDQYVLIQCISIHTYPFVSILTDVNRYWPICIDSVSIDTYQCISIHWCVSIHTDMYVSIHRYTLNRYILVSIDSTHRWVFLLDIYISLNIWFYLDKPIPY